MISETNESFPTIETKFGICKVESFLSYQETFTESNSKVKADIDIAPRLLIPNKPEELKYPQSSLRHTIDGKMVVPRNLSEKEITFINEQLDEDEISKIEREIRKQSDCDWKEYRKFSFIASQFHLISRRQRNYDTFASLATQHHYPCLS